MKKLGLILLISGIAVPLCAMQDQVQVPGDDLASLARRSMEGEEKSASQEDSNCAICLEDMHPPQAIVQAECVSESQLGEVSMATHTFHAECLAQWYAGEKVTCPTCRAKFTEGIKAQLEPLKQRIRQEQEDADPALRSQRESRRFWGKFAYFMSLGLGAATLINIPLVVGEFFSTPGPQGPIFADAADIIIPAAAMTAIPLHHVGRRLGQGR